MLKVDAVSSGYDKKQILFDVSMNVSAGEIVCVIGPNGSGKSTLLKTIYGLVKCWNGTITYNNSVLKAGHPSGNLAKGLSFSPQGNRVFDELSVLENLEIGGYILPKKLMKERVTVMLQEFPALKERLKQNAGSLSGGEKQMLALARTLMIEPKLLLLDEPSLGLAPNLLKGVFEKIIALNKVNGISVLIVEQKVKDVLAIADRVYALKMGKVYHEGPAMELLGNREKLKDIFL